MAISEYVKICPICGHENPEFLDDCEKPDCHGYLAFINGTPRRQPAPPEPPPPPPPQPQPPPTPPIETEKHEGITTRLSNILYLDCAGVQRTVEVRSGQTVGQAHATSTAEVQLADIPGINYVSREHCRFVMENDRWHVEAVATATNNSYLNQAIVPKGGRAALNNGDRLVMANVPFIVRIIAS